MAVLRDVRSDGSHHPDHLHLSDLVDPAQSPMAYQLLGRQRIADGWLLLLLRRKTLPWRRG